MTINIKQNKSAAERITEPFFVELMRRSPIPHNEQLENMPLFLTRQTLTGILHLNELYQKILDVPGDIVEFGVRWGRNIALWQNLRGIYEPYNHTRKIVGFDTFAGFPKVTEEDGDAEIAQIGAYGVTSNYEGYLAQVIAFHHQNSPLDHMRKDSLRAGDACKQFPQWLSDHPEAIVALAYFDFDVYAPTQQCLTLLQKYLTKGSVLVFDQLNYETFPGETIALRDMLSTQDIRLQRSRFAAHQAYCVWGQ